MEKTTLTYLGHSTFVITTPGKVKILVDPWLEGNPACPLSFKQGKGLEGIDLILVTHGHFDHASNVASVYTYSPNALTVAQFELAMSLMSNPKVKIMPMNIGGTFDFKGVAVTMVKAEHSSSVMDSAGKNTFVGTAAGFIVQLENKERIYIAGDTALMSEMKDIIGGYYKPAMAIVPIGGLFTMSPADAYYALDKLIKPKKAVGVHYLPALEEAEDKEGYKKFMSSMAVMKELVGKNVEFEKVMKKSKVKLLRPQIGESVNF